MEWAGRATKLTAHLILLPMLSLMGRIGVFVVAALVAAAPVWAQRPDGADAAARAEQLFVRALTHTYLGEADRAIELFNQVLQLRPGDAAVYAALAEAHETLGDFSAARFYAVEAVAAAPQQPSTLRHLGALELRGGDVAAALATFTRLVELSPRDPDAVSTLARVQQQSGHLESALQTYHHLLDLVGESASVRARMLQIHQSLGDDAGAAQALEGLLETDAGNPVLVRQLADLYVRLDRVDEAIALLARSLALQPEDPDTIAALMDLRERQGGTHAVDEVMSRLEAAPESPQDAVSRAVALYLRSGDDVTARSRAHDLLESAAAMGDLPTDALFVLGELRYEDEDFEGAAEALEAALALDPRHPRAWATLAAAQLYAGRRQDAARTADEGLLLFPGQYPLLRIATLALAEVGRPQDALHRGRESLEVLEDEAPGDGAERSAVLAIIGLLHQRLGDYTRSDEAYAEAVALDPDNAIALSNAAYAFALRGQRLDRALEMASRAVEIYPSSPSFLDSLGWVHYARGEYDQAATWLRLAVEAAALTGQPSALILEHLGDAEAARGRTAEALRHWQAALDLDPDRSQLRQKIDAAR
jgi:tetratricopeptide (TPR) repeat protein